MTNYELGIVFPLKDEAEIDRVVCYERPPKQYDSKDRPWVSLLFAIGFALLLGAYKDAQIDAGGPE